MAIADPEPGAAANLISGRPLANVEANPVSFAGS
jgi:hypothetical protein